MKNGDTFEDDILTSYEKGELRFISPSRALLKKYRDTARATFIKDRRVNIRLSSPDLMDIQVRALEEGVPYQTLIASVLHKFVTGRGWRNRRALPFAQPDAPKSGALVSVRVYEAK